MREADRCKSDATPVDGCETEVIAPNSQEDTGLRGGLLRPRRKSSGHPMVSMLGVWIGGV